MRSWELYNKWSSKIAFHSQRTCLAALLISASRSPLLNLNIQINSEIFHNCRQGGRITTRGKNFHRTLKWLRKTFIQTLYIDIICQHRQDLPQNILIMIMILNIAIIISNAVMRHSFSIFFAFGCSFVELEVVTPVERRN